MGEGWRMCGSGPGFDPGQEENYPEKNTHWL